MPIGSVRSIENQEAYMIKFVLAALGSASIAAFFLSPAFAESQDIELGWTNLPECSRLVSSGQSILGNLIPDTYEHTPQRATAYVHVEAPSISHIWSRMNYCAINVALPSAGLALVLSRPAAAQPAFFSAFNACMTQEAWSSLYLHVETKCEGW
jgi:hypothetical protein